MFKLLKYSMFFIAMVLLTLSCATMMEYQKQEEEHQNALSNFRSFQDNRLYRNKFNGLWTSKATSTGAYEIIEFNDNGSGNLTRYNINNRRISLDSGKMNYKLSDSQIMIGSNQFVITAVYDFIDNNTLSLSNVKTTNLSRPMLLPDIILLHRNVSVQDSNIDRVGRTQQSVTGNNEIETALLNAIDTIISSFQKEDIIAIVNISSNDNDVSEFIAGELEVILFNIGFTLVDRIQLNRIREEQNLQMSGEVSDASAVSIGQMLGANVVITGSVFGSVNMRRLRLRVLDIQTARVIGTASEAF